MVMCGILPDMLRQKLISVRLMMKRCSGVIRRKLQMNVKHRSRSTRCALMLLILPVVLVGCSNNLPQSGSNSGSITSLSALGRQPQKPVYCLPTCSANLSSETVNWQNMLIGQQKQGESVKSSMTH